MTEPYAFVVSQNVLGWLGTQAKWRRRTALGVFEGLALDPFQEGERQIQDHRGRIAQVTVREQLRVTFWVDHAVREVRIVDIERA